MRFRPNKNAFSQWLRHVVDRHEEFGIAECLQRSHAKNYSFAGALRSVDLPIQLAGIELSRRTLDAVPVGAQPNKREGIAEDLVQRRPGIKAERVDLRRSKADAKLGLLPRGDRHIAPSIGRRSGGSPKAYLRDYRQRKSSGQSSHPSPAQYSVR